MWTKVYWYLSLFFDYFYFVTVCFHERWSPLPKLSLVLKKERILSFKSAPQLKRDAKMKMTDLLYDKEDQQIPSSWNWKSTLEQPAVKLLVVETELG